MANLTVDVHPNIEEIEEDNIGDEFDTVDIRFEHLEGRLSIYIGSAGPNSVRELQAACDLADKFIEVFTHVRIRAGKRLSDKRLSAARTIAERDLKWPPTA